MNIFQDIKTALLTELSNRTPFAPYVLFVTDTDTGQQQKITVLENIYTQVILRDVLDTDYMLRHGWEYHEGYPSLDDLLVIWIEDYNIDSAEMAVEVMFTCDEPVVVVQ